jgi:hypothetical protein
MEIIMTDKSKNKKAKTGDAKKPDFEIVQTDKGEDESVRDTLKMRTLGAQYGLRTVPVVEEPKGEETKNSGVPPLVSGVPPLVAPDPFDAKALRLPPAFVQKAGIRKVISTIPVRKPHGQEWLRVHSGEGYSDEYGVIILKDDNEFYLLHPNLVAAYENEMTRVRIFVCMSMNKNLFLWPAKLHGSGNKNADRWANSAIEAAEAAMQRKVRIQSNRGLGAYEHAFSDNPTPENDPVWPDLTYSEMLRIGFAKPGRFVDDHNHEVLRLLREG